MTSPPVPGRAGGPDPLILADCIPDALDELVRIEEAHDIDLPCGSCAADRKAARP